MGKTSSKRVTSSTGLAEANVYDAVRSSTIHEAGLARCDVMEVPDSVPVLIGQLLLEHLDLVVDFAGCTLIGNPARRRT